MAAPAFVSIDRRVTLWMARNGPLLLRVSVGVVFVWFGVLKFFPGLSPADELATRTISRLTLGAVPGSVSRPVLAAWETLVGVGLITGLMLRATVALLLLQMAGTVTPLWLFAERCWHPSFPVPTLEGQYIIKNIVIMSGALVVGATVRGGGMIASGTVAERARRDDEARAAGADAPAQDEPGFMRGSCGPPGPGPC